MEHTTTGVATGTSLEILAPYLPYGIEVEVIEPYGFAGERYKLWGIDMRREFPVLCNNDEQQTEYAFFGLLPCLKKFDALTQQLPDGAGGYFVPAIEAAKLELEWPEHFNWETAKVEDCGDMLIVSVELPGYPRPEQMYLHKDWGCLNYKQVNYLRSLHFAVGLPETAYIPL